MAINWPPLEGTYPSWPPAEFGGVWLSCSDWQTLVRTLQEAGFTHAAPTAQERAAFFNSVLCGNGDQVIGRMLVSPDGSRRYPFAVCKNAADRELLVLWPPYTCGWLSGPASF